MKIISIIIFLLCWTIRIYPCELSNGVPDGTTYPPFIMKDENGKMTGLSIELTEALLREAGCSPVYTPLPFARILKHLENGKLDIGMNLSITEERKSYIKFIGPMLDETMVLVVLKGSTFDIHSLDDLKKLPKPVGIERGKVYGKAFEGKRAKDLAFRNKLEEVSEFINHNKLNAGRISCFIEYDYYIYYKMKTDPLYKNFTIHPFIINRDWVYWGFSKQSVSDETYRRLQAAYLSAKKKGLFEAIRLRYSFR